MGIQGLIPFLEKASTPVNVSEFVGCTVAIDTYCWLHKGAFACADKLARGDDCDTYVLYCMKFVNMLLSCNIKPILVFDGQRLPAKSDTEKKRHENREANKKKAAELMRMDRGKEAQTYLRRCVDITHEMALNLIRACRARNVDCIVAPYEADAQLAYLAKTGVANIIVTEDSDLLLFGAKKVLFKMDVNGNGLLIDQEKLHCCMGVRQENFSFDKFRYMCILSGCDYLPSLPGIGLVKACRFITRTTDPDIHRAISRMSSHLNMPQLTVTMEYRNSFMAADFMFKYQPVFDPFKRCIVPLNPFPEDDNTCEEKFKELLAIKGLSREQACDLAYGNLNPFTLAKCDNWRPEVATVNKTSQSKGWNTPAVASHPSIWTTENYVPNSWVKPKTEVPNALGWKSTLGAKIIHDRHNVSPKLAAKRLHESLSEEHTNREHQTVMNQFKEMYQTKEHSEPNEPEQKKVKNTLNQLESPKKPHYNPWMKKSTTPSPDNVTTKKNISALTKIASMMKSPEEKGSCPTIISRYFCSPTTVTTPHSSPANVPSPSTNILTPKSANSTELEAALARIVNPTRSSPSKQNPPSPLQRSPLKTQNTVVDGGTSEISGKTIKPRKILNPFAVKDSEKRCSVMYPLESSKRLELPAQEESESVKNCASENVSKPTNSVFRWNSREDFIKKFSFAVQNKSKLVHGAFKQPRIVDMFGNGN